MKPVAIFRHLAIEGPGHFATFLDNNHIPWQLIKIDAGEALPTDINQYSGLVFMGGPMSVNDALPWIPPALELIQQAIASGIPTLGHCLGGQLMSKALGGTISSSPAKEMGWHTVDVADNPVAVEWLHDIKAFEAFHWHGENFTLPVGATRLISSRYCENQVFALGMHLGMQCHVEMTEAMVKTWCKENSADIANPTGSSMQTADEILENLAERVTASNKIADMLYTKWIKGLKN